MKVTGIVTAVVKEQNWWHVNIDRHQIRLDLWLESSDLRVDDEVEVTVEKVGHSEGWTGSWARANWEPRGQWPTYPDEKEL